MTPDFLSGNEANAGSGLYDVPYRNNKSYNAFGEMTSVTGQNWAHTSKGYPNGSVGATNGRISTSSYDAAGNATSERIDSTPTVIDRSLTYDAAGRNTHIYDPLVHSCCENNHTVDNSFDGNGSLVKEVNLGSPPSGGGNTETDYNIRSTVLGGEMVGKMKTYDWTTNVDHQFIVPINGAKMGADIERYAPEGIASYGTNGSNLDSMGSAVADENPYTIGSGSTGYPSSGGDPTNFARCAQGGDVTPCNKADYFDRRGDQVIGQILDKWAAEKANEVARSMQRHEALHSSGGGQAWATIGHTATTSTAKPESDPQTSGPLAPASMPCEDSAFVICTNAPRLTDVFATQVDASRGEDGQTGVELLHSQTKRCVFNVNLKYPKEWANTDYKRVVHDDRTGDDVPEVGLLRGIKDRMTSIFDQAGATLVFNNPAAAKGTRHGNYNLTFTKKFTGIFGLGAILEADAIGMSLGDKGQVAYDKVGLGAFDLADVGAHETGHHFLEELLGSKHGGGIMQATFSSLQNNTFTAEQAKALSDLCNK